MINVPLSKCLLAALSVLSCVDAVAPSTTPDVAFAVAFDATAKIDPEMRGVRPINPSITSAPSSPAQARRSQSSAVPPQWLPVLSAASVHAAAGAEVGQSNQPAPSLNSSTHARRLGVTCPAGYLRFDERECQSLGLRL